MSGNNPLPCVASIIVGHGSILSDAGAAMLRIANQLCERQVAPIVAAGFLNYNRPTFADAVATCVEKGADSVLVLPYFLIAGTYVCGDLQEMVEDARRTFPWVHFTVTDVLGSHSAIADLAQQRLAQLATGELDTRKLDSRDDCGLLFVAHGTPLEAANLPIVQMLRRVQEMTGYREAKVGFLDCNQPDIPAAFETLAATGVSQIDVLPYFLHLGRHVQKDLPAHFDEARKRHEKIVIRVARHLDDEEILVRICSERISENLL